MQRLQALRELQAEHRARTRQQRSVFATPGELSAAIDRRTVQTEALDLIDCEIIRAWNTPDSRTIISMPPQEGKSERCTKNGVLWALSHNPDLRIGIVSYAQSLAESFGRDIRNRIAVNNGDEGTLDLGLRIARDNGSARRWQIDGYRGGVVCVGIGSGLTGRPLDGLVIDDPFADAEQADSQFYRERVWDWWQAVGSTRLAPGAPVIVILTRWHEDDLAGRLLAAEDGHLWRVINIPALADHKPDQNEVDPLGRQPGQWLNSARGRTPEQWEAIRVRSGSRVFNALYQGRPSPDTGNVWKRQHWRRYDRLLWSLDQDGHYLVEFDEVIQSWDMAFKDTKGSDFVVGQVWGRKKADVYLLYQIHKRLSFTDTITAFQAISTQWPQATLKLVEDKANGTAVIDTLKSKISGIVAINPKESKYSRATAVSPFIESGNVWLPDPSVALFDPEELIDEAAAFPNGAHDDQVDATSQALARLLLDGSGAAQWLAFIQAKVESQQAAVESIEPEFRTLADARQAAFRSQYQGVAR